MVRTLSRRQLLHTSAGIACAATAGAWVRPAPGIEPIARTGEPKFKLSLAAYSYRDLLTGKDPPLTLDDFVRDCAAFGLEGTELTSYYFPQEPAREYLLHIKELCFRLGLDVSGTAVGNDFTVPPGPKRDEQIAGVMRWIEYAAILGAPVIRIFSGAAGKVGEAEARRLAVEAIETCCAKAGEHGIYLALENHGGLTDTAEGTLALVEAVRSPWFGVNLDTGNFRSADVYGDLARLAPYAVNVQVKVMIQPQGGQKQPSDLARLAKILRDAAYRGYVVLEYEEGEDPRKACPRHLAELRAALA
ncbi:MAG: sugar phosphate isomerase/epimerase [Pirellulales bacterium]|nr:sugar phosphate isomerase/epimerase [Pirellulales bacterium]